MGREFKSRGSLPTGGRYQSGHLAKQGSQIQRDARLMAHKKEIEKPHEQLADHHSPPIGAKGVPNPHEHGTGDYHRWESAAASRQAGEMSKYGRHDQVHYARGLAQDHARRAVEADSAQAKAHVAESAKHQAAPAFDHRAAAEYHTQAAKDAQNPSERMAHQGAASAHKSAALSGGHDPDPHLSNTAKKLSEDAAHQTNLRTNFAKILRQHAPGQTGPRGGRFHPLPGGSKKYGAD